MTNGKKIGGADWLAFWILFSSWCGLAGWLLSLIGALTPSGYGVALLLFAGGWIFFRRQSGLTARRPYFLGPGILRSRSLLPKIWLVLVVLILAGGLLYHPNNFDYLTYRFPRVLNWWWAQRWHWIDTNSQRMNYSAAGFEWLMVPALVLFKTDRLFFLYNFISFLFLPGLVFSVFRRLGISSRVSWWWMWVLPCGYCFLLQAGGTANDSYAAVYLLASLYYALIEKATSWNLALSLLSIALLTGAKASNIPLVLPWLLVVFQRRRELLTACHPAMLALALPVAATVSFLPMALMNVHYTGDYSGDPMNQEKMKLANPLAGIVGNSLEVAVGNLAPPFWPRQISWEKEIPAALREILKRDYPRFQDTTGEMPMEEGAGLGLGVTTAAGLMILAGLWARWARPRWIVGRRTYALVFAAGVLIALLAYMAKMGSESAPRLIAPYYPLLIAAISILVSLDGAVVRRAFSKIIACVVMLTALPLVVLSPSRPLFPVRLVLEALIRNSSPAILPRLHKVYGVYSARYDDFSELRAAFPATETVVGFLHTGDDPEVSLWLPLGSRLIQNVTPEWTPDQLKAREIHYVVVDEGTLRQTYGMTMDDLLKKWSATVVTEKNLLLKIQRGTQAWYVLRVP